MMQPDTCQYAIGQSAGKCDKIYQVLSIKSWRSVPGFISWYKIYCSWSKPDPNL